MFNNPIMDEAKVARMEDIHLRIKRAKDALKYNESMLGPIVLGVIGAVFTVFIVGIFLIIIALIWAYMRYSEQTKLKALIFQYESELSRLQGM